MNVLYVEDYALGAALVRDTFKRRAPDIHLEIVSTVAQALARLVRFERGQTDPSLPEAADTPHYDVVLTDLNLPDGLGLEILTHVRSRQLMLAVVILTGSGQDDTVIGALRAGANDYVTKRDDYLAVLPRTLRTALERFRSETARASNPLQVLYADADSADVERVRSELQRLAPYIVIEPARSSDEVLARLRAPAPATRWPDVLLLDYRLPGMPIVELLKQVSGIAELDLPVVLVTGEGDERIAQLALRLGVADFLGKSEGYLQRLPFALEGAHLKAVSVRERAALRRSEAAARESARLARGTVDALSAHLAILDDTGTIIAVNHAWRQFASANGSVGGRVSESSNYLAVCDAAAATSPEAGPMAAGVRAVMSGAQAEFSLEYPCDAPDEKRWFNVRVTRFAADGAARVVVAHQDITERKHNEARIAHYRDHLEEQVAARTDELADANRALTQARDAADAANRAKSTFLATMSHEIRTPTSSIIGLARLMRAEITHAKPLEYLAKLQGAADHLLRIVNDVLDLSKIEAHQLELEDAEFSLRQVLTLAIDMLQESATAKGLVLSLAIDEHLPQRLNGDALRLEQIVLNFLSNAIKFSPRGTIHVRARLLDAAEATIHLRIEVQDTGIGMSAGQQQRLFRPFSQGGPSTSREYGGTGLGLVIARRLAGLMGGDVGVVSEESVGSTFWVTARLREARPRAGTTAALAQAERAGPLFEVARGRVLLVEDDATNQLVTGQMLLHVGFQVDTVDNGADAVERARVGDYAIVLMDVQMPVMDGLEATRRIRQLPGGLALPIMAMTASAFDDDRQRCLDAGMDGHITKPIDVDRFLAALLHCIAAKAAGA